MVEEGGLTFTFADAPEKIEAVEKPPPPVRTKAHHSPPPLRALKSAPDSAPKRRRSSHTVKADDDDDHGHRSAPSKNRVDTTPDDPGTHQTL